MKKELTLNQIQKKSLEVCLDIISVCEKYHIRYMLYHGTLIGAVKYQGFIPWDDDIDLAMMREDYERFIKIYPKNCNENYKLLTSKDKNYLLPYAKVMDINTESYMGEIKLDYGVSVDILPIDFQSDDEKKAYKEYQKQTKLHSTILKFLGISKNGDRNQKIKYYLRKMGFVKLITLYLESCAKKYQKKSGNYAACNIMKAKNGSFQRQKVSCYTNLKELEFEGYKMCCPAGFDSILKNEYGNYMEAIPEDEQISHHPVRIYEKER